MSKVMVVSVPVVHKDSTVDPRKTVDVELTKMAVEQIIDAAMRVSVDPSSAVARQDLHDALHTYGVM